MSALFTSLQMRDVELENRIVVSPMCQYSSDDGSANDWHLVHLGHLALAGPALVFCEATHVSPEGRITDRDAGLYSDANAAALEPVVHFIRRWTRAKFGIQLAHAGRKGATMPPWEGGGPAPPERAYPIVAPSAIPFDEGWHVPRALDDDGLEKIRNDFVAAARRAAALGFDVVELHFAHGYLAHEFLSPLSNERTDRYGGSLQNRMRFPLELFDCVRAVWPEGKPLGVRVSATDWVEGGWTIDDCVRFASALAARGCDFVDASSGGLSPKQQIDARPGYQVPFAQRIKREAKVRTIAIGLITDPRHAEEIVASGSADLVALARGFLREPRWPWDAGDELGATPFVPNQYARGRRALARR